MRLIRPFAAVLTLAVVATAARGQQIAQGKPFPDFQATNVLTGEEFSLSDYRGTVVLIDFWATWCGPCVRELPTVQRTYERHRHQGFEIISISLDNKRDRFDQFVAAKKMTWPQVMEGGGWKTRLAQQFGITSIPRMFLVDRDGTCIGVGLRGRAVEKTVKLAVTKTPPSDPAADEPKTELTAEELETLRADVLESRDALKQAAVAMREQRRSLLAADGRMVSLEMQFPRPADPAAFERDYQTLREELVTARAELFAAGALNDRVLAMPVDAFSEAGAHPRGPVIGVRLQLPNLRQSLATMNLAVTDDTREFEVAAMTLDALDRELASGRGNAAGMRQRSVAARQQADGLRMQSQRGWQDQLRGLDGRVAKLMDTAGSTWPELKPRASELRRDLEAAGDDPRALSGIRRRFVVLSTDMLAWYDEQAPPPVKNPSPKSRKRR